MRYRKSIVFLKHVHAINGIWVSIIYNHTCFTVPFCAFLCDYWFSLCVSVCSSVRFCVLFDLVLCVSVCSFVRLCVIFCVVCAFVFVLFLYENIFLLATEERKVYVNQIMFIDSRIFPLWYPMSLIGCYHSPLL